MSENRIAERIGRNDATFRAANDRISAAAGEHDLVEAVPFICECAEESCSEIVRLSLEEYEGVRGDATLFLNVPGHEVAAGAYGEVVARNDRFVVVRKLGRAADVTVELDPRSPA